MQMRILIFGFKNMASMFILFGIFFILDTGLGSSDMMENK